MKNLILLSLFIAGCASAQLLPVPAQRTTKAVTVTADPSGSCYDPVTVEVNSTNGKLWICVVANPTLSSTGSWTAVSGGGGSTTRTWSYAIQALCQGSTASAAIWIPTSNAPSYTTCTSTTQQGEWQIPASTTAVNWGHQLIVPSGATGNYTLNLTWRTADTNTGHLVTITPSYACVAASAAPDNPSYTNLSAFNLVPSGSASTNTAATYTFSPTCAAGAQLRVLLTATTNTVTSATNISYESISVQASN